MNPMKQPPLRTSEVILFCGMAFFLACGTWWFFSSPPTNCSYDCAKPMWMIPLGGVVMLICFIIALRDASD